MLLLACALAPPALAGSCGSPVLDANVGTERSRWSEFDGAGGRLVKEGGWLKTVTVGAGLECAGWTWQGHVQHAQGNRDYDGRSNNGAPLQTSSDIRRQRLDLQAWRPGSEALAFGAQLNWTMLDRDIAGVGWVKGYPEQFRYLQAAVGARYAVSDIAGMRFGVEAWLGAGPAGHVTVQLPGFDEARLRLGRSQWARLGLSLSSTEAAPQVAGWGWQLRLDLRQENTRAGQPQPLYRHGVLAGGAVQPKFRQTSVGLDAGLRYRF
ncbi:hypothetical protein RD110_20055 [Rhodoferax koreense]|uniref:Outer membrane protein beta-barrel domain-containing protein n=2 Tax=Rhodoferax koreensis TaxID=1842727 RepID=A0A1P8JZP2_9BURK|nr:hypothetical protein RD110_20055 [Rhodoferax koreense]